MDIYQFQELLILISTCKTKKRLSTNVILFSNLKKIQLLLQLGISLFCQLNSITFLLVRGKGENHGSCWGCSCSHFPCFVPSLCWSWCEQQPCVNTLLLPLVGEETQGFDGGSSGARLREEMCVHKSQRWLQGRKRGKARKGVFEANDWARGVLQRSWRAAFVLGFRRHARAQLRYVFYMQGAHEVHKKGQGAAG